VSLDLNLRDECVESAYLDEGGVLKDLLGVADEFQLLHDGHGLGQVQDHACGCNAEISLQKENRN